MNVQNKLALGYIRTKLNILSLISEKKAGEELFRLFCTPFVVPEPRPSEVFGKHEKLVFSFQGKKIQGYRCNAGASKTALLLHGFSSCAHNFDGFVEPLITEGYAVLAFDAPAHGSSEGKTINAVEYAGMVSHIIKEYGPLHALIGHSFGGLAIALALENHIQEPEPRVVLIAPATETTTAIDGAMKFLSISSQRLRQALEKKIETFSGQKPAWFSIRRAIGNIKGKILWIHDESDTITPINDVLKVRDDGHSHVTFHFTKGLGHRRIYKDAAIRRQIMNFLS